MESLEHIIRLILLDARVYNFSLDMTYYSPPRLTFSNHEGFVRLIENEYEKNYSLKEEISESNLYISFENVIGYLIEIIEQKCEDAEVIQSTNLEFVYRHSTFHSEFHLIKEVNKQPLYEKV